MGIYIVFDIFKQRGGARTINRHDLVTGTHKRSRRGCDFLRRAFGMLPIGAASSGRSENVCDFRALNGGRDRD